MAGKGAAFFYLGLGLCACSLLREASSFSATVAAAGSAQTDAGTPPSASSPNGSASYPPDADANDDAGNAAPENGEPDAGFCTGQAVTVADLASGSVRSGAVVLLPKLVASSQKFLLSASKTSGKCLWAAFAADSGKSGENSAVLLFSSVPGEISKSDGGAFVTCPSGTDSLPDDLAPGDDVAAFGTFTEYAPDACLGTVPMRELLLKPGCAVQRSGHGAPPAAFPLSPALADQLAAGKDAALMRAWSGARVELADLDALPVTGSASAVDAYGVIRFRETKLSLHSKIPYGDLSAGGPDQPGKSLNVAYPAHFEHAAGVLFLDYCTWSLEVCDPCADLSPQSRGCAASGG
jgi:hypothetical protein